MRSHELGSNICNTTIVQTNKPKMECFSIVKVYFHAVVIYCNFLFVLKKLLYATITSETLRNLFISHS